MKSFVITFTGILALPASVPLGASALLPPNLTDNVHVIQSPSDRRELMFLDISPWEFLMTFVADPLQDQIGAPGFDSRSDASNGQQAQQSSASSFFLGVPAANGASVPGAGLPLGLSPSPLGRDPSPFVSENMFSGQSSLHDNSLLELFLLRPGNQTSDSFQLLIVENHGGVFTVQTSDVTGDPVAEPRWLAAFPALLIAALLLRSRLRVKRARLEA